MNAVCIKCRTTYSEASHVCLEEMSLETLLADPVDDPYAIVRMHMEAQGIRQCKLCPYPAFDSDYCEQCEPRDLEIDADGNLKLLDGVANLKAAILRRLTRKKTDD